MYKILIIILILMSVVTWDMLAKNQTDPETVEQAVARLVNQHNAAETAHVDTGQSLSEHKVDPVIDHPAESIINDKIEYVARTYSAIVALSGGDFDNIQDAIDYVNGKGGGSVFVMPGTYTIDYNITLYSNVELVGAGSGLSIFDFGDSSYKISAVGTSEIHKENINISGLKFLGEIAPKKYNLLIGAPTAEEIKITIGSALPLAEELSMEVQGRDQIAGLPKTISITSGEVTEAISEPLAAIVNVVRSVLERTPPELSSDIIDRGIAVLGGGGLLRNIDRILTQETGVPCYIVEEPISRVAVGAGRALDNIHILRQSLPYT